MRPWKYGSSRWRAGRWCGEEAGLCFTLRSNGGQCLSSLESEPRCIPQVQSDQERLDVHSAVDINHPDFVSGDRGDGWWYSRAHPDQRDWAWALVFVVCFFSIHWQEITSPSWNVDDWALLTDPILQAHQSRPTWDLIYGLLFQNSFSPFFNWLIAAASLLAMAAVVGCFFPSLTAPWRTLLALLISAHAYLLDLFNFSFCQGLYLLPALLSLLAALLMGYGPRPLLGRPWLDWSAGVGLQMLAMGLYQPTGYAGLGLIALDLLARALEGRCVRPWAWLRVLAGALLGCLLYLAWARLAMAIGHTPANARTGFASWSELLAHLFSIGIYREIYNTNVPLLSTAPQFLFGMVFLGLLLVASLVLARRLRGQAHRGRRLAQLWLAAALCTSFPLWLSWVLRSGFPSRAFCLANLGLAWFTVVVLVWLPRSSVGDAAVRRRLRRFSQLLVALLVVGYLLPQAAFASKVWDRLHLLERRDMAMAQMIASDVRSLARVERRDGSLFRLFGTSTRTQSFPHWSSVGESAFRQSWSIEAIFQQLLGLKVESIPYRQQGDEAQVRARLPACRAWPDPASIVWHQGAWLVCLEANPASPAASPPAASAAPRR